MAQTVIQMPTHFEPTDWHEGNLPKGYKFQRAYFKDANGVKMEYLVCPEMPPLVKIPGQKNFFKLVIKTDVTRRHKTKDQPKLLSECKLPSEFE